MCTRKESTKICQLFVAEFHEMAKITILIALLLLLCTMIHGLSSCSDFYRLHAPQDGYGRKMGEIRIPCPPESSEYNLTVRFKTKPSKYKDRPIAHLQMVQSISEIANIIHQGQPLLYHVYFLQGQMVPILTKIWLNDQQICAIDERKPILQLYDTTEIITTKVSIPVVNSEVSPGFKCVGGSLCSLFQTSTQKTNNDDNTIDNNDDNNNNECGINSYTDRTNLRISNGVETMPGQWPWLVALFAVRKNYEFKCAGSILTTKHIITAAHCLKVSLSSNDTLHSNVLVVALGRFSLHQWRESGTLNREVSGYWIHPDYAHGNTADSDLAILILRTPVEYNPFIKPICLWSGLIDLQNVVSKIGYVVGWGRDEFGNPYTSEPRMALAPIVSQETCLRSHRSFFDLTSVRTFCAGLRNQSGPCNGDSGSGLVIYDAITDRYQLRGLVSRAVAGNDILCDLKNYVVYVDVAKYVPWIQKQISTT